MNLLTRNLAHFLFGQIVTLPLSTLFINQYGSFSSRLVCSSICVTTCLKVLACNDTVQGFKKFYLNNIFICVFVCWLICVRPAWRSSSVLRSFEPQQCPLLPNQSKPQANEHNIINILFLCNLKRVQQSSKNVMFQGWNTHGMRHQSISVQHTHSHSHLGAILCSKSTYWHAF